MAKDEIRIDCILCGKNGREGILIMGRWLCYSCYRHIKELKI